MYLVFTVPKRLERTILLPHYVFGKYFLLATQENIDINLSSQSDNIEISLQCSFPLQSSSHKTV